MREMEIGSERDTERERERIHQRKYCHSLRIEYIYVYYIPRQNLREQNILHLGTRVSEKFEHTSNLTLHCYTCFTYTVNNNAPRYILLFTYIQYIYLHYTYIIYTFTIQQIQVLQLCTYLLTFFPLFFGVLAKLAFYWVQIYTLQT